MLNDLLDQYILVYMDDVFIYSRFKQRYMEYVKWVFKRNKQNWHVKSKKCILFLDKVKLLSYILRKCGISIANVKVSAVYDWSVSKTMHEVQGFL